MTYQNGTGSGSIEEHEVDAEERLRERVNDAEQASSEAFGALDRMNRILEEAARKWAAHEPVPTTWDELFTPPPERKTKP